MHLYPFLAPTKKVKVGRNTPCPCGRGKKYKKCCLQRQKPVALSSKTLFAARIEPTKAMAPMTESGSIVNAGERRFDGKSERKQAE
jgi:hypothetical protein